MSLVKQGDLIIPNTVGIITAAVKEANRHLDKYREHSEYEESKNKNISEYIREMPQIHTILQSRVNGVPLDKLVESSRISNDKRREMTAEEARIEYEMGVQPKQERAYEDWFRG